jgi:hypothetical protein
MNAVGLLVAGAAVMIVEDRLGGFAVVDVPSREEALG